MQVGLELWVGISVSLKQGFDDIDDFESALSLLFDEVVRPLFLVMGDACHGADQMRSWPARDRVEGVD